MLDGAVAWTSVVGLKVTVVVAQRWRVELINHDLLMRHRGWSVGAGVGRTSWLRWGVAGRRRVVGRRESLSGLDMWHRSVGHDSVHCL